MLGVAVEWVSRKDNKICLLANSDGTLGVLFVGLNCAVYGHSFQSLIGSNLLFLS